MFYFYRFLIYAILVTLMGCGFHFRDESYIPQQLNKIYVESDMPFALLTAELKQTLKENAVTITTHKKEAPITLKIFTDDFSQMIMGSGATNQITNYLLVYKVSYQLFDNQGHALLEPSDIKVNRNFTANNNQLLGSLNEQLLIKQDMRQEAIMQIMDHLSANITRNAIQKKMFNENNH